MKYCINQIKYLIANEGPTGDNMTMNLLYINE